MCNWGIAITKAKGHEPMLYEALRVIAGLPQDFSLVNCLLNISDILLKAMNALQGIDSYWNEVVGEYMKEWYKCSVSLRYSVQKAKLLIISKNEPASAELMLKSWFLYPPETKHFVG